MPLLKAGNFRLEIDQRVNRIRALQRDEVLTDTVRAYCILDRCVEIAEDQTICLSNIGTSVVEKKAAYG